MMHYHIRATQARIACAPALVSYLNNIKSINGLYIHIMSYNVLYNV